MSVIRIGIVEDEVIIADDIHALLLEIGYDVVEPCGSFDEAINMLDTARPDLILLDINLGGIKDGVDIGHFIRAHINIPFIFLTANSDTGTVQRAKACSPDAYLVKPFDKGDLYGAIEVALHNFAKASALPQRDRGALLQKSIFVKDGDFFHKVNYEDILFISSEHVYITIHTSRRKYLVRATMQEYQDNLDPDQFFRIHRGFIVNVRHIDKINSATVVIAGNEIPLSRNYKDPLLRALNIS